MKLPQIVAREEIPGRIPAGTPSGWGAPAEALAQGAHDVGRETTRTALIYGHAARLLQEAKAKAELDQATEQIKSRFADADIELRASGIDPDQYPRAVEQSIQALGREVGDGLTTPEAKAGLQHALTRFRTEKVVTAKYDALKMKQGQVKLLWSTQQLDDANAAINGASVEDRQAAFARGLARSDEGLRTGIYSDAEAKADRLGFLRHVELGGIRRDVRNPELRPGVLSTLLAGGYRHLPPEEQDRLATTLQAQSDQEYKAQQDMLGKWWTEQQQLKVSDLYRRASAGTLTPAQLETEGLDWRLHRSDIAAIQTEMTKPAVEPASDPATLDRVDIAVHASDPTISEGEIRTLRARGLLNRKDTVAALDKLISRQDHIQAKGDSVQMQHHRRALEDGKAAFNIPDAADKYEGNQGKIWAAYTRELTARSNAFDGQEDALKVADELIPRFKVLLGDDARLDVEKLRGLLNPLYPTLPALKTARASGTITQGEYEAQVRVFIDLNEAMIRQQKVDEEAAKLAAERAKKEAEKQRGLFQRLLPSFGPPPTNLPTTPKDLGRP